MVNDVIIRIEKANSMGPYIEVPIYKVLKYEGRVKNIEDIPSPGGMELDVDYGTEFVEADKVEKTSDVGHFPTRSGGSTGGVPHTMPLQGGSRYEGDDSDNDSDDDDQPLAPQRGPVMVPPPPPEPPEDDRPYPPSEVSSSPWRGAGFQGRASTPAVEAPAPPGDLPSLPLTPVEEVEEREDRIPGHDVSLPESEDEDADQPPSTVRAPSLEVPRERVWKNVRFGNSPYPLRERKRPAHLEDKYLDGGAQTRGPPAAPDAGGSDPLPEQQPLPPEEEDSDLEKTIPNSEDGNDEYLASEDNSEIAWMMTMGLRPGPIHKGV